MRAETPSRVAPRRRENLIGALWMVAAMAAFAVEDALIKTAAAALPVGQILLVFGLGGAALFALAARLNGEALAPAAVASRPMLIRVVFEVGGRLFYALAIALTPLSSATVILQATPLVVVAGAALVFGERVGWRRWGAVAIGLLGVVVIVQPGAGGFSALSALALLGMIGFAGRDLASRAAPASIGVTILGLYGFLAIALAGLIYALWEGAEPVRPGVAVALCLLGTVLAGAVGYTGLMKAMRTGEISAVTPFRYTRLLFGVALGVLLFGERVSLSMLVGSGLIVLSGLFILGRARRAGG